MQPSSVWKLRLAVGSGVQWEKKRFFGGSGGNEEFINICRSTQEHTEWDYLHNGNQSVQAQNGLFSHSWSAFWLPLLPQQLFSWLCHVIIFYFFKKWCARKTVILCNKHESHIWYGYSHTHDFTKEQQDNLGILSILIKVKKKRMFFHAAIVFLRKLKWRLKGTKAAVTK